MKKLLTLVTATMLFSASFACDGKDCAGKKCTKAEMAACKKSKKECKKATTTTTVKNTKQVKVVATKKA